MSYNELKKKAKQGKTPGEEQKSFKKLRSYF